VNVEVSCDAIRIQPEGFEHLGRRHWADRAVDDDAQRALFAMVANISEGAVKVGIRHIGHGD